jgi:RNase_H superfamily
METKFKILLFDIETAPSLGYSWNKYETTILKFEKEWYMLSFAYKWLGQKEVIVKALPDYPNYSKDHSDDKALVTDLWNLFNEADLIIGQNLDKFDIRKANTRFLYHGLTPPEPYKTVDTLKLAKKYFAFNSNKLDDLGEFLGVGRKVKHEGIEMWLGCMAGDPKAWAKMKKYNKQDVLLLEKIYNKFRPWHKSHPNITIKGDKLACPVCGSPKVQKRGYNYLISYKSQRYHCQVCGHWSSGKTERLTGEQLK